MEQEAALKIGQLAEVPARCLGDLQIFLLTRPTRVHFGLYVCWVLIMGSLSVGTKAMQVIL
jgi:uncharacterized membrane protein